MKWRFILESEWRTKTRCNNCILFFNFNCSLITQQLNFNCTNDLRQFAKKMRQRQKFGCRHCHSLFLSIFKMAIYRHLCNYIPLLCDLNMHACSIIAIWFHLTLLGLFLFFDCVQHNNNISFFIIPSGNNSTLWHLIFFFVYLVIWHEFYGNMVVK